MKAEDVAIQLLREIRPDLYRKYPRSEIERLASGEALGELQNEIDRAYAEIEELREELADFRCPHCNTHLVARIDAPADPSEDVWDDRNVYECGFQTYGGSIERLCPKDPHFPKFDDYELKFQESLEDGPTKWMCIAIAKTVMAKKLRLPIGYGKTKEEAGEKIKDNYDRYSGKLKDGNMPIMP